MAQEDFIQIREGTRKDCGAVLGAGREDRQYCDDGCRTNFNNRKRREMLKAQSPPLPELHTQETEMPGLALTVPEYITRIQEILLKNREIMESLCDDDRSRRLRFHDFIGKGFFCCYTGLAFVDVTNLKPTNICKGEDGGLWIKTFRQKTTIPVNVPLLKQTQRIMDKYQNNIRATANGTIFSGPFESKDEQLSERAC